MTVKPLGIPQTKGTFKIVGIVSGMSKSDAYMSKKNKSNNDFRRIKFSVQVNKNERIYLELTGNSGMDVTFSKKADKNAKSENIKVKWNQRYDPQPDGYRMMGVNLGIEKKLDKDGKEVNDNHVLTPFDAIGEINELLKDGMSVFVKGNIEYGHYPKGEGPNKEIVHTRKFVPNQISLLKKDIDFTDENFEKEVEKHTFEQIIIMDAISKREEDKAMLIDSVVVNYATIENTEFVVHDVGLAKIFAKNLKQYNSVNTWGNIVSVRNVEETVDDGDGWGAPNPNKVTSPYKIELVITGADKDTFSATDYTAKIIDEAIEKTKEVDETEKAFNDPGLGSFGTAKPSDDEWEF